MTKNEAIKKLLKWAKAQVGYKPPYGKVNKYAEYLDSVSGYYNTPKQGADWCDVFVDCGFAKCFGNDTGRKMVYQPLKSLGAGVYFSAQYYKQHNAFFSVPKNGDQIFYGATAGDHTGIVVAVSETTVTTIEGNWNNMVCQRTLSKSDYRIAGYGRPDWSLVEDQKEEPIKEEPQETQIRYTVKLGDTLGAIAEKYGTTVDRIVKDNGIPNRNLIYPGAVYIINTQTPQEEDDQIKVGDNVKLIQGARDYYGGLLAPFVYNRTYKVTEISGDRAVIEYNGVIVAAVHIKDLVKA